MMTESNLEPIREAFAEALSKLTTEELYELTMEPWMSLKAENNE